MKLPAQVGEAKKEIYFHPETLIKKCDYSADGVRVTVEVVDEFLSSKFQELVAEQGESLKVENFKDIGVPENAKMIFRLKEQLVEGDISISEYKEKKLIVEG